MINVGVNTRATALNNLNIVVQWSKCIIYYRQKPVYMVAERGRRFIDSLRRTLINLKSIYHLKFVNQPWLMVILDSLLHRYNLNGTTTLFLLYCMNFITFHV